MSPPAASAGRRTGFLGQRRWPVHWVAGLAACVFVAVFTAMSWGILSLQQRIVGVTNETRDVMMPMLLEHLRAVRNLEMLRHYGTLAAKAMDPQVRQDAAFLAALAALSPVTANDTPTRRVVDDAYHLIRAIAAREREPALWPAMEDRLTQRADEIANAIGNLVRQRATEIHDDSLRVRNIAVALALLFAASMGVMLVLGRVMLADMRTKHQLFNEASHDFRQRLHGMQLLINSAQRVQLQEGSDIVLRMKASTADLQRYLDNFLELARLEAGMRSKKPKRDVVDLQGVFQQLELQFEEVAQHYQVEIKFRNTPLSCHTDERLLLRILENLIANALKFARKRVLVAARRRAGLIEVWVADDGPGMPEFQEPSLWKAFVQGDAARDGDRDRGFGLGMSIVMRCASLLKASVRVSTVAGRGSAVRVGIPGDSQLPSA